MINLGLERIKSLVDATKLPWKAIHVAGTNGKGSLCWSLYGMLNAAKIPTGLFMSPHLIDRWDGISLRGKTIERDTFLNIEKQVKSRDERLKIGATEFELLTAAAFEAFNRAKVEIGVVEVGLGGALDATNVLYDPIATIITQIAKDHQAVLGNGLLQIAAQKAGIMKPRVPCLVDGLNKNHVIELFAQKAKETQAGPLTVVDWKSPRYDRLIWQHLDGKSLLPYQRTNLILAYEAFQLARGVAKGLYLETPRLIQAATAVSLPGRKQTVSLDKATGQPKMALLDGAHNMQSIAGLKNYVQRKFRQKTKSTTECRVTWILAFTNNKNVEKLLDGLISRKDDVIAIELGPVDGMPWIQPFAASKITELAHKVRKIRNSRVAESVEQALEIACEWDEQNQIVIAGSLYLVSDVLRFLRSRGASDQELGLTTTTRIS